MADAPDKNLKEVVNSLKELADRVDPRAIIIVALLCVRFFVGLIIRKARMKKRYVD
ncbi:MAG: hypothetical protein QM315_08410 [Bacillota bacterium]|jgi:hypothetical protein|nr:hypothetical protein [Bacillota bacterium]NLV63453.1 hypothetical protein [Clostridiaceae bacterium]